MMIDHVRASLTEDARQILHMHLAVGPKTPVSYLPIKTIENVIGIPIHVYTSLIKNSGNKVAIFGPGDCCIDSGAIYAYSYDDLDELLRHNRAVLVDNGWPTTPADFVERIAAEWLHEGHPIMPTIRRAFGDE
jgi:hypothetical protein